VATPGAVLKKGGKSIPCDVMVIGGEGLAGRAIVSEARRRGMSTISASRNSDVQIDLQDAAGLLDVLEHHRPNILINAAAIVSVPECEANPGPAWIVNARAPFLLSRYAKSRGAKFVQISTDHYYSGDGRRPHAESEPVILLNEYARTKYAAETLTTASGPALILRTNFIGVKSGTGASFGEWANDLIINDKPGTLFSDQFVSSLDVWSFASALLDLVAEDATGVVNLASSEVFSKADLVLAMARALERPLTQARPGTVASQSVVRPDSLGLDVSQAEAILRRRLPHLEDVAASMAQHILAEGVH
jgi:dTDP-4-dehydrorhamnose reductase